MSCAVVLMIKPSYTCDLAVNPCPPMLCTIDEHIPHPRVMRCRVATLHPTPTYTAFGNIGVLHRLHMMIIDPAPIQTPPIVATSLMDHGKTIGAMGLVVAPTLLSVLSCGRGVLVQY